MKLKGKKSKIVLLLVIITTSIWGMIIYKVVDYLNAFDKNKKEIILDKTEFILPPKQKIAEQEGTLIYLTIDRDPFVFRKKQTVKKIISAELNRLEPIKPKLAYEIKGIIINDRKKLVVFEDKINSKTVFLREGEVYQILKLIKITTDKVILIENGAKKEISIK